MIDQLLREGRLFEFFQLVRTLQRLVPDAVEVGHQGPPQQEAIRLRPSLNMTFASSDVEGVDEIENPNVNAIVGDGDGSVVVEGAQVGTHADLLKAARLPRYRITTNFLGMYGTESPMPTYFTEELMEAEAVDPDTETLTRGYLDLFHHRALSLFYRVWEKYRAAIRYKSDGSDYYSMRLLALIGAAKELFPDGHRLPAQYFLTLGGLLIQQPRSAVTLRQALQETFPESRLVIVTECVGQWVQVPRDQQNRLAICNTTLGIDLTLGEEVFNRSCSFRVSLGPLRIQIFMDFLPIGERHFRLREIVDLFNTDCLDYEVELWIDPSQIPELRLSAETARLGWSSWLGRRPTRPSNVRFFIKGWFHGGR